MLQPSFMAMQIKLIVVVVVVVVLALGFVVRISLRIEALSSTGEFV